MRFPAIGLGLLLLAAVPAHAQLPRVAGTLTQSGDGPPVRANLFFQPPDSLKIEVFDARNQVIQTVVANGNQTQTFDARTKRLGVLGANIAREWYRGAGLLSGGPANFAFSGATGFTAGADQGIARVRDIVLLGSHGNRAYYVASKQRVRAFPARVEIKNDIRTDFNDQKLPLLSAKISFDAQKLPLRADVGTAPDTVSFAYALKPQAAGFAANTFALPDDARDAIREDSVLRAPSAYADASPDEIWNHGTAVWNATGDSSEALALWARATLANPRATAPRFSTLQVALAIRAPAAAARALEGLKPLLSDTDFAWASVPLDELRADHAASLRDLRAAATTGEPDRLLALSLAQRAAGDIGGARTTWKALLSPSVPRAIAVKAAENIALAATKDELPTLGQTLPGDDEATLLARALLDLRAGKTSSATFTFLPFRASFARALERAGQSDAARPIWESLETNASVPVQNEARIHLITILARAGDASGALALWNRWNSTLQFDTAKQNAQNTLFDAFQKAGKSDALRVLLLNRSSANAAKDADLRLSLAFQETFGTDADVSTAIGAGFDRFSDVPFWEGRRADTYVTQGLLLDPIDDAGFRRRNQLFKSANDLLDKAIASADDPTFFTLQKALVAIQRATNPGAVINANDAVNSDDAAHAQLAMLDASSDPDYQAVATLGWSAFPIATDRAKAIASARRALDSAPVDGDRATLVFATRQAVARVYDTAGDFTSAAKQWIILLDIARTADDEAGLIAALLTSLERHKDATGMAQLLVRVGGEHWPLDANAALLAGAAERAAASAQSSDIAQTLDTLANAPDAGTNSATKSAIIARAAYAQARLDRANAVIAVPGAPPTADAELERATRALSPALAALQTLADSDDPFLATRARLLLLDSGTLASDERLAMLKKLSDSQGGEPSVVLARANAETDPQVRAQAARTLAFQMETWRHLSLDALRSGDKEDADFWSREAFEFASTSPEVDINEFQNIGFARARILWAGGQIPSATALYNNLAGPGWNPTARAAALLGLRKRLQEAGRAGDAKALDARLLDLSLTKSEAQNALALLSDLDG